MPTIHLIGYIITTERTVPYDYPPVHSRLVERIKATIMRHIEHLHQKQRQPNVLN